MEEKRTSLDNLIFPPSFFEDEVREGFLVTTMMKRYWASQLKVLSLVDAICRRHNLKWFADYGTLLGAVRHGGFIPWDDDLDICMLREDWNTFFEVAENELPEGFKVLTVRNNSEYEEIIGRVVNSPAIDTSCEHLSMFFGCPYTVGVDIFPLDGLYNDPEKEKDRIERTRKTLDSYEAETSPIKKRQLLLKVERLYGECPTLDAENLALMPFYIPEGHHIFPKKLYENCVELAFENTYIRAPGRYDELLSLVYGDYLKVYKGGGMHDYPVYTHQEKMLRDKLGRNPFRYTFDSKGLLGSVQRFFMRVMKPSDGNAGNNRKKVAVFLPCKACWWQQMEPLWKKYKEDENYEVHVLPIFYFETSFDGSIGEKHDERDMFPDYVNAEPCERFDFAGIHPDIIVIQVPFDGWNTAITVHEYFYSGNLLGFTDELIYVPCFDVDEPEKEGDKASVSLSYLAEQEAVINADRVIVSSKKVRDFYIKKLTSFGGEETLAYWQQKIVTFESLNEQAPVDEKAAESDSFGKKTLLYYVTISDLLRWRGQAIKKLRRSLEVFKENKDKINVVFCPQSQILDELPGIDPELFESFKEFVEDAQNDGDFFEYDPEGKALLHIEKLDAYYGDPSPYVRKCVTKKIPVMIQAVDI